MAGGGHARKRWGRIEGIYQDAVRTVLRMFFTLCWMLMFWAWLSLGVKRGLSPTTGWSWNVGDITYSSTQNLTIINPSDGKLLATAVQPFSP